MGNSEPKFRKRTSNATSNGEISSYNLRPIQQPARDSARNSKPPSGNPQKRRRICEGVTMPKDSQLELSIGNIVFVESLVAEQQLETVWDLGIVKKFDDCNVTIQYIWEPKTVGKLMDDPEIVKRNAFFYGDETQEFLRSEVLHVRQADWLDISGVFNMEERKIQLREGYLKELSLLDADIERSYCYCEGMGFGRMIECGGRDCQSLWFHLECVGLEAAPSNLWCCGKCRNDNNRAGDDEGDSEGAGDRGPDDDESNDSVEAYSDNDYENCPSLKTKWTEDEDILFLALRDEGKSITEMVPSFPNRSRGSIVSHQKYLGRNKLWTKEQEERLLELGQKSSSCSWDEISGQIPGMDARTCQARYQSLTYLNYHCWAPGGFQNYQPPLEIQKKNKRKRSRNLHWTPEEDKELQDLVLQGYLWKQIALKLKGKEPQACRRRNKKLEGQA